MYDLEGVSYLCNKVSVEDMKQWWRENYLKEPLLEDEDLISDLLLKDVIFKCDGDNYYWVEEAVDIIEYNNPNNYFSNQERL